VGRLGEVTDPDWGADAGPPRLRINGLDGSTVIDAPIATLKEAWRNPLKW
jgi:hypothetical protein